MKKRRVKIKIKEKNETNKKDEEADFTLILIWYLAINLYA